LSVNPKKKGAAAGFFVSAWGEENKKTYLTKARRRRASFRHGKGRRLGQSRPSLSTKGPLQSKVKWERKKKKKEVLRTIPVRGKRKNTGERRHATDA